MASAGVSATLAGLTMCPVDVSGSGGLIERWNAELAFRSVFEATADKAGLEFLADLVKNLAQSLGVKHAFVAEFAGARDRVKPVAFWSDDGWRPNVEYPLAGTPCQRVASGELCFVRDDVQSLFPDDHHLAVLGARSYVGLPLCGAGGQPLGHLAALDIRPMPDSVRDLTILEVFANRARVEVERLHAETVLQRALSELEVRLETTHRDLVSTSESLDLAYSELRALLEINQSSTRHLDRAALFAELARSVKPLLPCERFGIEVPTGPESLRVHVLALDRPSSGPMVEEFPSAGTACRWAQESRQWYACGSREELRALFPRTYTVMEREEMESLYALPLLREERSFGALFFMSTHRDAYAEVPVSLIERVGSAVAVAVDNCFAYEELRRLRDRLAAENVYLKEEIRRDHNFDEIVGTSPALARVLSMVEMVAPTNSSVLILGETGTGKELIARAIHNRSRRRQGPLVKVNCSAISAGLVESELFGHVRGAFTGAVDERIGRFEVANGGTIFLDEVGELPAETQVKLLRVLQEREVEPVGSNRARQVDVRVIAATNRDLEREVAEGRFRADLFFRLNVFPIVMPPLRDREGDVEPLIDYFVSRFASELGKRIDGVSRASLERLLAYHWPGNIRELSNVIERAVVLSSGPILDITPAMALPAAPPHSDERSGGMRVSAQPNTLAEVEREHLVRTLSGRRWVIEGPDGAAAALGMRPSTLRSRMKKLGIGRPMA